MVKTRDTSGSSSTTSTTVPKTTPTTVPGGIVAPDEDQNKSPDIFTVTGTGYAGGYDPAWKAPDKALLNNPQTPYHYKTNDWQILLSIPESEITGLQTRLMKAYPNWKPGQLGTRTDTKTVTKFKQLMGQINLDSNIAGADWSKALDYLALHPVADESPTKQRPAIRLTNPIDLKSVFKKASTSTLGRALSDKEITQLVTTYQGLETTYQQQASTGSGATVVQAPDAGAFAEQQARKLAPQEATANDYTDYVGALSQLLQG